MVACYVITLGVITWRSVTRSKLAPAPVDVLHVSLPFGLLGVAAPLIGEQLAATLAVGVLAVVAIDVAAGGGPRSGIGTAPAVGAGAAAAAAGAQYASGGPRSGIGRAPAVGGTGAAPGVRVL
jgi:hypothetical protein